MGRSAEDTRRRIMEAAYELFYSKGFQRTGVDEVADLAGFTKRTFYAHFASKDDLIGDVLTERGAKVLAQLERWMENPAADPSELVRQVVDYARARTSDDEWRGSGFTRAAMEVGWMPGHPALAKASAFKRRVEALIGELLARSGYPQPIIVARQIMAIVEGVLILRLIHGDEAYIDAAEAAALAVCERGRRLEQRLD